MKDRKRSKNFTAAVPLCRAGAWVLPASQHCSCGSVLARPGAFSPNEKVNVGGIGIWQPGRERRELWWRKWAITSLRSAMLTTIMPGITLASRSPNASRTSASLIDDKQIDAIVIDAPGP